MNDLPEHLDCLTCGAIVETSLVLAYPAEFIIEPDGDLHCPFCCDGVLRDTSTINQLAPISTDMPAVFAAFIETLEL